MKVNGSEISGWAIGAAVTALLAAGALQTQVRFNANEIEKHEDQPAHVPASNQITSLSVTQESIKEDLNKIEKHTAAQTVILNEILRELAKDD
jgi:hypothetical protein